MHRFPKSLSFAQTYLTIPSNDPVLLQQSRILQYVVFILYGGAFLRIGVSFTDNLGPMGFLGALGWLFLQIVLFTALTVVVLYLIHLKRITIATHLFFLPLFIDEMVTLLGQPDDALQHGFLILLYLASIASVLNYQHSVYYILFCFAAAASILTTGQPISLFIVSAFGVILVAWVIANAQKNALAAASASAAELESLNRTLQERVNSQMTDLLHRNERLQFSLEIGRSASSSLNLDKLLYNTAHLIRDEFQFYHVTIFLSDDKQETLSLHEATGEIGTSQKEDFFQVSLNEESIISWVARNQEPKLVENVIDDPLFSAHPLLPDTASELALPLIARGILVGVLDVQDSKANAFTPGDITILQLMADQLANNIDNARLFTTLEQRTSVLSELQTITNLMSQQSNTANALNVLAKRIKDLVEASGAAIFLWNPELSRLELALNLNIADVPEGSSMNVGEGLAGQCYQNGQTMVLENYGAWTGRLDRFEETNIHAIVNVPLKERELTIGVLSLVHTTPERQFSPVDIQTVELLAAQAGTVITNQQLIERTRELVQRERLVSHASAKVRSSLDAESVLKATATQLGQALSNRPVKVRLFPRDKQMSQQSDQ